VLGFPGVGLSLRDVAEHRVSATSLHPACPKTKVFVQTGRQIPERIKEKEFAAKLGEAQSSAKSGTKNLKSSNPKGSLLRQRRTGAAGGRGVWGEFRPPYKFWAKSVRIFSKAHRHNKNTNFLLGIFIMAVFF